MNYLNALAIAFFMLTLPALSEFDVYKTKDGVVVLSRTEGQHFTLNVDGNEIIPMGQDSSPYPIFRVDGRFFQIAVIRLRDFKGDASKPPSGNLKKYLAYEKEFYKDQLKKGREALGWKSDTTEAIEGTKPQTNIMLSFVHRDYLVTLCTSIDVGTSAVQANKMLTTAAESFIASDKEITIKFADDGTYTQK
jgi:hypothetical protein